MCFHIFIIQAVPSHSVEIKKKKNVSMNVCCSVKSKEKPIDLDKGILTPKISLEAQDM